MFRGMPMDGIKVCVGQSNGDIKKRLFNKFGQCVPIHEQPIT